MKPERFYAELPDQTALLVDVSVKSHGVVGRWKFAARTEYGRRGGAGAAARGVLPDAATLRYDPRLAGDMP